MRIPTLTAVLALAYSVIAQEDVDLRQLTDGDFRANTARGLWLVEHFSPRCGHCRAFAPTWTKLARDKQHLERLAGFHMAQVNCLAQGDLCNSNGIKFYPQIILYKDGQPTQYSGERTYEKLEEFIETHSSEYARTQLPMAPSESEGGSVSRTRPNPEGRVMEVDEKELDVFTRQGPVLVDFYAPWCSHCKKLRPTYDKLAEELKDKVNIVAVDCDAHRALCTSNGVRGFPTIKMLENGKSNDYTGSRSLDKLKEFALKSVKPTGLVPIKMEDFEQIVQTDEVFFLYLQTFETSLSDLDNVKKTLEPLNIPAYTSVDSRLYANLSIANPPPTSALLAFSSLSARPLGSLSFPTSEDKLRKFAKFHRYPTVMKLTTGNFNEIMKSEEKALVILAAFNKGGDGKKELESFQKVAKAWRRGGRDFSRPVWFVHVEGDKWAGWLKQAYGIKKNQLPGVVIIDPPKNEYYDTTIEGTKLAFEGASIFSVLEGVYQHFLRPKISETALEWGSRSATMTLITTGQWTMDHPFIALFGLTTTVGMFVWLLHKCVARDLSASRRGAYGGEKGEGRLD